MPLHHEPLSGGLVTSRHASTLEPGELVVAQDARYRANDPALRRAWGRTKYINANGQIGGSSVKVKGLAFCPFDPIADGASDDYLVAHRDDKYYVSVFTGRTGTISGTTIDNVGTGTHLDATHANNKWYLFNGNSNAIANQVLKPGVTNPTSRRHGLIPVALSPANPTKPTVATSAGSWPTDEAFWGEGRFFFFTTEVVNPGGVDELESAAMGEPPFVELQQDAAGNINFNVTVTRHNPLANSNATEVRVYMVKANLSQAWDMSLFARAFRVGTISVSGTPANDKIVLSANYTFYDSTTTPTAATVSGIITSPTNAQTEDGLAAIMGTGSVMDVTGWGFALPASTTVLGLKVWIRYRSTGGLALLSVQPRIGAGPTLGTAKAFSTNNTDFVMHQQPWPPSDSDTWGLTLTDANVNASTFGVRITNSSPTTTASIDVVKLRVFTGILPTIGPAYPIVAVQLENVLTIHHANLPPPVSSTGDVHDGQLVVDNVQNLRELAYSLPGKYDYFPSIYKLPIDGKDGDRVIVIRRVGDILMAFMRHQLVRINYLPLSVDPEFNPGRAYEEIGADHGCVSKLGVATFTPPGRSTMAGFVSDNGVYVTDTARSRIVTEDIDWAATVDVTQLSKAVLTNYAKEHVLRFDYVAAGSGATENNRYLLLHYHPSHIKPGEIGERFKITGPNFGKAASSCVAKLLGEKILITGHTSDGRLYVEDNGEDDAEGTGINFLAETRENYIAQTGQEVTVTRAWWHVSGGVATQTATSTPRYRNTGEALTDATAETFTPSTEGLVLLQHHIGPVEGLRFRLSIPDAGTNNNSAVQFTHLIIDHNNHGTSEGD